MMREHHHHHGHARGREEVKPCAVLASSPMHTHAHSLILVAMRVGVDGANAGPARSSPARGAASGSNLESFIQAARGALASPATYTALPSPVAAVTTPRATHRHHHRYRHYHSVEETVPARTPGVSQAALSFHPATATGSAGTPTGATANAHSAATASADFKEGGDLTEGGSGVGQGQNVESDGDSAEGVVASVGVGNGRGSGGLTVSTVGHVRVGRWSAGIESASDLHLQPLPLLRPSNLLHISRLLGAMTTSEFARPRGASEHGHGRVAGLPSANSNTTAPANHVTSFFGPGNILGDPPATSMSIPISMRPRARAAFPPDNPGLDLFSAEEQATVRSFLSADWMSGAKALADDAAGYAAAFDADIEAHIATFEHGRAVECMRAGERALPDRIQALDERDCRARARMSPSRSTRDASAAGSSSGADVSEDDMILG
ncbi:hypothetical protein DFH11DRAFT_1874468 [Phellopilus nigrolimitatus]|nr:hypothetical protein DFH11DRAFT_1874468 [Phellopilus nigrolimitatus]